MEKGRFIVLDGTDGSGKSTQARLLIRRIKKEGYPVRYMHFPQHGRKSAAPVDEYLNGKYPDVDPYVASIFYAIDRFDASFKIRAWLRQGFVVVCDRYVTSNAGHQGARIADSGARKKYFTWLKKTEYDICKIPRPDITLILHVPAAIAYKHIDGHSKRLKQYVKATLRHGMRDVLERDVSHLKKAEKTYLQIAKNFPPSHIIECTRRSRLMTPEQIHEKVWAAARRAITK